MAQQWPKGPYFSWNLGTTLTVRVSLVQVAREPSVFSAPEITVQERVKIVCESIGLERCVSDAVVQRSPLVPVTVQPPTAETCQETVVGVPEERSVGWTEKLPTDGAGGALQTLPVQLSPH